MRLFGCVMTSGLLAAATAAAQPSSAPSKPDVRTIVCYANPIIITRFADGRTTLLDLNDNALYATDDQQPQKHLTATPAGDLSYTSQHGDLVKIAPGGDRTTSVAKLGLTIHEGPGADGKCQTKDFAFADGAVVGGVWMTGTWTRSDPRSGHWERSGARASEGPPKALPSFDGGLDLTDFQSGEIQLTRDAGSRITLRRDGYLRQELLDAEKKVIHSVEDFPDGREIERRILDASALTKIGLGDRGLQQARESTLRSSNGSLTMLIDVTTPSGPRIIRRQAGDQIVTRSADPKSPNYWTDQKGDPAWLEMVWLTDDVYRLTRPLDRRTVTFNGDGSWSVEVFAIHPALMADLTQLPAQAPQYMINGAADGTMVVSDADSGRIYRSDAGDEASRLTIDRATGELSFINRADQKVVIKPDGSRTIIEKRGSGSRVETDAGGRMIRQLDANQKVTNEYHYSTKLAADKSAAEMVFDQYQDHTGLWHMTPQADGHQSWDLVNGPNGQTLKMAAQRITVSPTNSIVIDEGDTRTTRKLDGTDVTRTRSLDVQANNQTFRTEVRAHGSNDFAYRLTTTVHDLRAPIKEQFDTRAGHFVRENSGFWFDIDDKGKPKPDTAWAGVIVVDDEGTVIRRQYETEKDPTDPQKIRLKTRKDATTGQDVAIIEWTEYSFTDGDSERWTPDGGGTKRDKSGDIVWLQPAGGERIAFEYGTYGGSAKLTISGFVEGRNHWLADRGPNGGFYLNVSPNPVRLTRSRTFLDLNGATREFTRTLEPYDWRLSRKVVAKIDGSSDAAWPDGSSASTDADGRLIRYSTSRLETYRLVYDNADKLVRLDGPYDVVVVAKGYTPPPDDPLPGKGVVHATRIELRGWGDDKFISFVDEAGRSADYWPRQAVQELDRPNHVVSTQIFGVATIVLASDLAPDEKPGTNGIEVASSIELVRGVNRDKYVAYVTPAGEKVERFFDGSLRRYDRLGRIVRTEDWRLNAVTYTYASDGTRDPSGVSASHWRITTDAGGRLTLERDALNGKAAETRALSSARLGPSGNLAMTFAEGDIAFEQFMARDGSRFDVFADGSITRTDAEGRLDLRRNVWGDNIRLDYEVDGHVPRRVTQAGKVWIRQDSATGLADAYTWKEEKSGETVKRAVFAPDGSLAFSTPSAAPDLPKDIELPAAKVTIDSANGQPISLKRTVETQGKQTVTRKIDADQSGWVDDLGHRFTSFRIDAGGRAILADASWRLVETIDPNGFESETRFDDSFNVQSHVERDGLGRPVIIRDANFNTYRVAWDAASKLTALSEGLAVVARAKANPGDDSVGRFMTIHDSKVRVLFADIELDPSGNQVWRGRVERRQSADGTITIARRDGSRSTLTDQQDKTVHDFAPGNGVEQVTVFESGQIEVRFAAGITWRTEPFSKIIRVFDSFDLPVLDRDGNPLTLLGRLAVAPNGNLTFAYTTSPNVVVYLSSGGMARFADLPVGGWSEVGTGRYVQSRGELEERLRAIGAITARPDNAFEMLRPSYGFTVRALEIGAEEFLAHPLQPRIDPQGTRRWDFDDNDRLAQTKEGTVILNHSDQVLTADAGSFVQWADLKRGLMNVVTKGEPRSDGQPAFDPADVKAWINSLDSSQRPGKELRATAYTLMRSANSADQDRGVMLLRRAANAGDLDAQVNLAKLFNTQGRGEAGLWFENAAVQGNGEAAFLLSNLEDSGVTWPGHQNLRPPADALTKARALALGTLGAEKVTAAVDVIKDAATKGNPRAEWYLAELYDDMAFDGYDSKAALVWLRKAVADGSPDAMYHLGHKLYRGEGTPKDEVEAALLIIRAALLDNALAKQHSFFKSATPQQIAIATAANKGGSIGPAPTRSPASPDNQQATPGPSPQDVGLPPGFPADMLARAQAGMVSAQFIVGKQYVAQKDFARAKPWLEKAAKNGFPPAKDLLDKIKAAGN